MSTRTELTDLLFPGEYEHGRKRKRPSTPSDTAQALPATEKQEEASLQFWAVQFGKDMVVVTFQLLHILLRGYDPKREKPNIAWLKPENLRTRKSP